MTREDFELRVRACQGKLYRVSRGYLRGEHDCLDAISEAICKAWQKLDTLRSDDAFDGWIVRILIHECIAIQRRQKRVFPVETLPETEAPQSRNAELRQALDELPQKERAAVVLHYMEGYDVAEVARMLHTPRGTVCSRLHYARLKLRDILKEDVQ